MNKNKNNGDMDLKITVFMACPSSKLNAKNITLWKIYGLDPRVISLAFFYFYFYSFLIN